ncbi:hypothetical protein H4582DRAFT_1804781 [Lactarius indigo]|nr:hypothetical protein H4582DRAFT_1804781 [Lactarius indigo]
MTLLILLFYLFHYGWAQGSLPLYPFAFPLAVRSPYLNCWGFPGFSDGFSIVAKTFASVASGDGIVLVVLVRVDNHTSMFLGDGTYDPAFLQVNLTNTVLSPTQTVLIAQAGPMQINLTFLNPIEHGNWVKQSIPLSYMSLTAKSLDNVAHSVQVYSEFSAVWVSGNQSQKINWNGIGRDNVIGHRINRQISTLSNRVPTDTDSGTLHHFMKMSNNITWKTDNSSVSRHSFLHGGVLDSTEDAYYGPSNQFTPDTVFAMSRDLGTIKATQDPVIWVIGYTTDPVINYADPSGTPQQRSSVYKIQYPDDLSLIIGFMNDFADASSRARQLDQKILQEAAPISGLLGDLVSYVTAQVYGSIQLTVATDSSGELNKSDVMAFNTGRPNTNRVNPVEMLYSAFPAFMYIDPDLGGLLLEPLFRLQVPPKYTNQYAAQDLGTSYPNVVVSNSPHNQGVEDSGNMLIMTCAHARASGDINLIKRHYDLLTSWANYLSNSTLFMGDQYSADGLSVDNQTNLAIKGIIAIKAMSQMSSFINNAADFDKYSNTSLRLYAQWKSLALAGDKHLLGTYGDMSSWTLGYNLFADLWLNTGIVESRVSVC